MIPMILKVDQEPGTDRYVIWSAATDSPSVIGNRHDIISWLMSPRGDCGYTHSMRIMRQVDRTGTSDMTGRGSWNDLEPIPVGDISPDDGWYRMNRSDLPALIDAIAAENTDAIHRLLVKYA
jgi:hypothetical protein